MPGLQIAVPESGFQVKMISMKFDFSFFISIYR